MLGHYIWHVGIFGLSALVILRQMRNPFAERGAISWLVVLGGIIHGFTLFMIIIEAGTAPLGITYIVLVTFLGLIWGWQRFRYQPMFLFFFVACLVAIVFIVGWGVYWGGLPEFSEVGIID